MAGAETREEREREERDGRIVCLLRSRLYVPSSAGTENPAKLHTINLKECKRERATRSQDIADQEKKIRERI